MSLLLALTSTSSGVSGAAAWTESNDVLAASGKVLATTALAWIESNDVVSISGSVTTATPVSIVASWVEQNDVYSISGTSAAVTTPRKIGGDDVPRVEYWETRKQPKKHDEQLEKFIREQYEQITGKTTNEVREIIGDYDDDEEILLLLVL